MLKNFYEAYGKYGKYGIIELCNKEFYRVPRMIALDSKFTKDKKNI